MLSDCMFRVVTKPKMPKRFFFFLHVPVAFLITRIRPRECLLLYQFFFLKDITLLIYFLCNYKKSICNDIAKKNVFLNNIN